MSKEYDAIQIPSVKDSLIRRLQTKLLLNTSNGCIEWIGKATHNSGYGKIASNREIGPLRAHRLVWVLVNGEIPLDLVVMHSCDNPKCCNITHLSLGTRKDNMDDKMMKGRGTAPPIHYGDDHPLRKNPELASKGCKNGNSKLTEDLVKYILLSEDADSVIARELGISKTNVGAIRKRRIWKHVEV